MRGRVRLRVTRRAPRQPGRYRPQRPRGGCPGREATAGGWRGHVTAVWGSGWGGPAAPGEEAGRLGRDPRPQHGPAGAPPPRRAVRAGGCRSRAPPAGGARAPGAAAVQGDMRAQPLGDRPLPPRGDVTRAVPARGAGEKGGGRRARVPSPIRVPRRRQGAGLALTWRCVAAQPPSCVVGAEESLWPWGTLRPGAQVTLSRRLPALATASAAPAASPPLPRRRAPAVTALPACGSGPRPRAEHRPCRRLLPAAGAAAPSRPAAYREARPPRPAAEGRARRAAPALPPLGFHTARWAWPRSRLRALPSSCGSSAAGPGRGRRWLSGGGGVRGAPHALRGWQLRPRRRLPSHWPLWTRLSPPSPVGLGLRSGSAVGRGARIEARVCPAPSTPSPVRLHRLRKEGARRALEPFPPAGCWEQQWPAVFDWRGLGTLKRTSIRIVYVRYWSKTSSFSVNKAVSALSALCNCILKWDKL